MSFQVVGKSTTRWDAVAKVRGKAEYTGDIPVKNMLYGKICRATIAHGFVKSYDLEEALKVPGVVKILTPDDVPNYKFPTAGHPFSLDPGHKDIADRNILTRHVRLYGDEIAAVIAENELAGEIACSKIKVEYEELPFYLTPEEALKEGAYELQEGTKNILGSTVASVGNMEEGWKESHYIVEDTYVSQTVQHCHMENQIAYGYLGPDNRWICVTSTQIPHICRRVLGQAFNMPWSKFRVIKPFIGGGFGNKQDVVIEPLVMAMTMAVGGKPVMLELTREEVLAWTRVRHAIKFKIKMGISIEGIIKAVDVDALATNGAYASHGHSIAVKGAGIACTIYNMPNLEYKAKSVYTNTATAGAMRGYGTPQIVFALESHMDKAAKQCGFDRIDFRLKNAVKEGGEHPLSHIKMETYKLSECIIKGKEKFQWDKKINNKPISKNFKRGVGMAAFSYATGVYPYSLEIAGCRLILNQDGTIKMYVGATEIGQGSDAVFSQMVAETVGVPYENVYAHDVTDTDYSPFDTGAYASRQTYVTGAAVRKAAEQFKEKILTAAAKFYNKLPYELDIFEGNIVFAQNGEAIESLEDFALKTYYDIPNGQCITAEVSNNLHNNTYPCGVTYAEVDVDIKTGKVKVLSLLNVHDSGVIINPKLAEGQVEGGMGMGVGYCMAEELLYDKKTGAPLNNNLLDYKMPTMMDIPDLSSDFVEPYEPTGSYGQKGLGECPLCSPAAAIRNAIYDAIGVGINTMPISPQRIYEALQEEGARYV